ncbi:hypothetical protein F444_22994 [Phytophthora nicotianae P1976]|uniref:Uncharacterized protein n=1 Tax=Phytophthora nicotianae P1976 TaxID=1317066 RepID=A0A080YW65_PHYNI|nr:hypothetical protein F444_22994 [Phytophthora nicotianae P1976]
MDVVLILVRTSLTKKQNSSQSRINVAFTVSTASSLPYQKFYSAWLGRRDRVQALIPLRQERLGSKEDDTKEVVILEESSDHAEELSVETKIGIPLRLKRVSDDFLTS